MRCHRRAALLVLPRRPTTLLPTFNLVHNNHIASLLISSDDDSQPFTILPCFFALTGILDISLDLGKAWEAEKVIAFVSQICAHLPVLPTLARSPAPGLTFIWKRDVEGEIFCLVRSTWGSTGWVNNFRESLIVACRSRCLLHIQSNCFIFCTIDAHPHFNSFIGS